MTPRGLLLQFLPPFSIVARFFLTASLFGFVGSVLALYMSIFENLNLPVLVHTFTLGFLAMTMIGALFQMLPVVAGAVINGSLLKATVTHILLSVGIPSLLTGFFIANKDLILLGTLFTAGGFLTISLIFLLSLLKVKSHIPTSRGMKFSIFNFVVGTFIAILLILTRAGIYTLDYGTLMYVHLSFMLVGWVFLLIASVSFQVVEMFFVTPSYPKRFSWYLPPAITLLLLLKVFIPTVPDLIISALMILQALLTLDRFRKRRRKIPDPLIYFWQVGMVALIIASFMYPFLDKVFFTFLISFGIFAQSVVFAMMYRIIPFLVWLHLSNKGILNPPTMHEVISRSRIYTSFYVHLISITLLVIATLSNSNYFFILSSGLFALSFLILTLNLSSAILLYIRRASESGAFPQPPQGRL